MRLVELAGYLLPVNQLLYTSCDGVKIAPLQTEQNEAFAKRLHELGIGTQVELYGAGTRDGVYWQRELDHAWPSITDGPGQK